MDFKQSLVQCLIIFRVICACKISERKLKKYCRRAHFRSQVIEHKKNRTLRLGDYISLFFENELTIRYQIQEMLRIEKIFEEEKIQEEIDAHDPLIPDGNNLKATMMIEYEDVQKRHEWLTKLKGVEKRVWITVQDHGKITAIADEDLSREDSEKTSAVHFLRFEFSPEMKRDFKAGKTTSVGINHPNYLVTVETLPLSLQEALVRDFN